MENIRVAVVDDTTHVREMLVSMLSLDGFEVVGEAANGPQAIKMAEEAAPEVIVMDYSMPGMDGLAAAKAIREVVPRQPIILYTAYLDDALQEAAEKAGVAVCVGKVEGLATLETTIAELCLKVRKK